MQIRCPHCHQPIEVVNNNDPSGDMVCESCGSAFNLASDSETVQDDGSHARTIAHFTLVDCLGQGAFGSVWKARDAELDRTVAVKIPRKGQLNSNEAELFLREARSAAQLRHPNIVPVHEVGREDGTLYIVSDFIQGLSLADWLTGQRLTLREAADLCVTMAQALHHAHEAGVIHRDLKPANIMLDDGGQPHIMDFGLARREAGEITMTIEGKLLGTPAYMPPEQARGEGHNADRRSDLYSLGVILFELLTGEKPFRGNMRMLLHRVLNEEPPAPRTLNQSIPRDLETITLKCLRKDPEKRYQTTAEFAADLKHWLAGGPTAARRVSALERSWRWCRRKPALAGMWAVALLLLLTIGIGGPLFAIQSIYAERQARLRGEAEIDRRKAVVAQKAAQKSEHAASAAEANARNEADNARRNLRLARRYAYNSDMLLAQREWEEVHVGRVRELLDRNRDRDDLNGFEWGYWDRLAHSDLLTLQGHTHGVHCVVFSPDGTQLASGTGTRGQPGEVKVWDIHGKEILTLHAHKSGVSSVAFSPDGRRLASASFDTTVKVWDVSTGKKVHTLNGHTSEVNSVSFSPDGSRLASASVDNTVRVWDASTGQLTFTLKGHRSRVMSVSFSSDGTRLASASWDSTVKLWDTSTGQETLTLKGHHSGVNSVAFSPNGNRLASASDDQTVKVWDAATGQETLTIKGHNQKVTSVSFNQDGTRLASASWDQAVKVWDTSTGQEILALRGHADYVRSVACSPVGVRLASASQDGTVKVWDAATGQKTLTLEGHNDAVLSAAFSPDRTRLASASFDGTVKVWDVSTGQELLTLRGHPNWVRSVAFNLDGTWLASSGGRLEAPGEVKVWDVSTGQEIRTLTGHTKPVTSVEFSPDGTRLASASDDKTVKVWDTATWQELFTLTKHTDEVRSVAFSPDGTRLASASGSFENHGVVKLWDTVTGQETRTLTGHTHYVASVAFNPDGTRLASASVDKTVKVWDASTGQELLTLNGHTNAVLGVSFSPDGTRLASASSDQTVKVWDVVTGQETLTLKGHTGSVWSAVFSPDGMRLASASHDRTVKLWDARPWTPELRAESQARGLLTLKRERLASLEELQADLRADPTISETVRDQALDWSDQFWKNRRVARSVRVFQQVIDRNRKLVVADPDNAQAQRNLSVAYVKLGDENLKNSEVRLALDAYRKGHEILERLAEANPTDARAQRNLSVSYNKLGDVRLQTGAVPQAIDSYRKALTIRERLAQADLTDARAQRDLMMSHYRLGGARMRQFAYPKAAEQYRAGIAVLDRMISAGLNVESSRRERALLAREAQTAEQAELATGDWKTVVEQAAKTPVLLYRRAAEFAKQRKFDEAAEAAARFKEIALAAGEDKADQLYNAACVFGLCVSAVQPANDETMTEEETKRRQEYIDLSLKCLKDAVAAGYENFEHARKDPDLAALRELPEFQKLLESPRGKAN